MYEKKDHIWEYRSSFEAYMAGDVYAAGILQQQEQQQAERTAEIIADNRRALELHHQQQAEKRATFLNSMPPHERQEWLANEAREEERRDKNAWRRFLCATAGFVAVATFRFTVGSTPVGWGVEVAKFLSGPGTSAYQAASGPVFDFVAACMVVGVASLSRTVRGYMGKVLRPVGRAVKFAGRLTRKALIATPSLLLNASLAMGGLAIHLAHKGQEAAQEAERGIPAGAFANQPAPLGREFARLGVPASLADKFTEYAADYASPKGFEPRVHSLQLRQEVDGKPYILSGLIAPRIGGAFSFDETRIEAMLPDGRTFGLTAASNEKFMPAKLICQGKPDEMCGRFGADWEADLTRELDPVTTKKAAPAVKKAGHVKPAAR